jgi:hypothetical protein
MITDKPADILDGIGAQTGDQIRKNSGADLFAPVEIETEARVSAASEFFRSFPMGAG